MLCLCFNVTQSTNLDCPGGELFYHLRKLKKLSESEAKFYFVEILLAF